MVVNGDDIDDVGDGGVAFDGHRVCFLSGLTETFHRLDGYKVQVIAAAVKKNLALFITFFWGMKRVFDLTGLPTTW